MRKTEHDSDFIHTVCSMYFAYAAGGLGRGHRHPGHGPAAWNPKMRHSNEGEFDAIVLPARTSYAETTAPGIGDHDQRHVRQRSSGLQLA